MLNYDHNFFALLNKVNVNEHTEKKIGLTYLSWAWAWTEFMKAYPESFSTVYERADGRLYWDDGKTAWVKVGVTIVYEDNDGNAKQKEQIEYLPIMDSKNRSIPIDNITSMDVNKAIQRCRTKAIAELGLGCYIYAGEDLPEETEEDKKAKLLLATEIASLRKKADELVLASIKDMDAASKRKFAEEKVIPFIGGNGNYKQCNDKSQLEALVKSLSA